METMVVTKLECLRCGHAWWPKSATAPKLCPSCKSKYWDKRRPEKKDESP